MLDSVRKGRVLIEYGRCSRYGVLNVAISIVGQTRRDVARGHVRESGPARRGVAAVPAIGQSSAAY